MPVPACGLWVDPATVCCTHADPCGCGPTTLPDCPTPSNVELVRHASTLLNIALGGQYPGWCGYVDELCTATFGGNCSIDCRSCCKRDSLPVGDGRWPILDIIGVRLGSPTGTLVDPALYRVRRGALLDHLGDGWPTCQRIVIAYRIVGVPAGGPEAARRLACELRKLWDPQTASTLPEGVRSLSMPGVQMSLDEDRVKEGLLGWDPYVDTFLRVAPMPIGPRSTVWWPSKWRRSTLGTLATLAAPGDPWVIGWADA